jgi:hypothetical protein
MNVGRASLNFHCSSFGLSSLVEGLTLNGMTLDPDDDLVAAFSIYPILFGNGNCHLIFDSIEMGGVGTIYL